MSTATLTPALVAPISLTELNEVAALQNRIDTKYLVTSETAKDLSHWLPYDARVLEMEGQRSFSYHSIYFDTPRLDSYHLAAHSRRRRFKIRTRAYCDSQIAFLEVKTKGQRGITSKVRIPHDFDSLTELSAEDLDFIRLSLMAAGIEDDSVHSLEPTLATGYRRVTYVVPERDGYAAPSRVTVDTGLYWEQLYSIGGGPADDHALLFRPTLGIIETKSMRRSSTANRLLWERGIRPIKVSKYCTGAAALDPRLPAHKWHRALRTVMIPEETV